MTAARVLTEEDVRRLRMRAQRLDPRRPRAGVDGVVREVFAVQAQDDAAAALGIWTRGGGLTVADVAATRERERSIVRTWCLRGTLHVVPAEDARWLLDLLRPTFVNANRSRRATLGLDDDATARGVQAVVEMLGSAGALTRAEIAARLARLGIPCEGQATIHVLWRAGLDGLVCYGPDRNGEASFVLLDEWVPPARECNREAALTELARRYLHAYGPARPEDLAAWSGLSLADARRAWGQLGRAATEVETVAGPMWLPSARTEWLDEIDHSPGGHVARLLPAFDGLWLGYRNRDILLPPVYGPRVYPGGGVIRPTVLLDGQVAGTWTRRTSRDAVDLVLDFFGDSGAAALEPLQVVATDLGRFLGRTVRLVQS